MKLDIRPVSILTRAILDTSPAWAIVYNKHAFVAPPDNIRGHTVRIDGADCDMVAIECFGSEISVPFNASGCYPCKADAPFEPIPWPLMPGEVEIEEWRTLGPYEPELTAAGINRPSKWVLDTVFAEYRLDVRPGFHPAPRRQINPDGTETPVWVWEKDV